MREECGVFGIYKKSGNCAQDIYFALTALQHRGQEGCGIAVNQDREIQCHKHLGLVNDVFDDAAIQKLQGNMGVGHVRYSTKGENIAENVQPLVLRYIKGTLSLAHNGNLVNAEELKKEYEKNGAIFQTTSDTEIIAYTIAKERINCKSIEAAIARSLKILKGAYSIVVMSPKKLIAARDPWGFRPLSMGRCGDDILFASESCAFDALHAQFERDLRPGEIVVVEDGEVRTITEPNMEPSRTCIFEYIYFARPDSVIDNQLVYDARKIAGQLLAIEHPVEADIVTGVPDSGIGAAIGYAMESKIPYETAFVKNRYIGRTFIQPTQTDRELAVRQKLNPLRSIVEGKRVVMVDDSIVRGTTCKRIVRLLREAGAKEVHVRISSPPFINPCYFGTDIPSKNELTACSNTIEEIKNMIEADSLGYLSIENLHKIAPDAKCSFCDACFTGDYAVAPKKAK